MGNNALTFSCSCIYMSFGIAKMSATSKLKQLLDILYIDGSITLTSIF